MGSTPLGVILGGIAIETFGSDGGATEAWFKAVAARIFLYVATLDVVREEFFPGGTNRERRLICTFLGAGLMARVGIWM